MFLQDTQSLVLQLLIQKLLGDEGGQQEDLLELLLGGGGGLAGLGSFTPGGPGPGPGGPTNPGMGPGGFFQGGDGHPGTPVDPMESLLLELQQKRRSNRVRAYGLSAAKTGKIARPGGGPAPA